METHLQNRSFHVVELEERERLRNILKMKNAGSKHAELLFFIVKYVNLRRSCLRRGRDCLSSLMCLYAQSWCQSYKALLQDEIDFFVSLLAL